MEPIEDVGLLARVALEDAEAWGAFVRGSQRRLWGMCLRAAAQPADAEEVYQDICLSLPRIARGRGFGDGITMLTIFGAVLRSMKGQNRGANSHKCDRVGDDDLVLV